MAINNQAVFLAAYASLAGFYSGVEPSGGQQGPALAWATAVDQAWGSGGYTQVDLQGITLCSMVQWQDTAALGTNPATYASTAASVVALVRAATAAYTGAGGTPTPTPPGVITKVTTTITTAQLIAQGAATQADFNIGPVLPAGAFIFPSTLQVSIDQVIQTSVTPANLPLLLGGGNGQGGRGVAANVTNAQGIVNAEVAGIAFNAAAQQGGQQIGLFYNPGFAFNTITAGQLTVTFLYCTP